MLNNITLCNKILSRKAKYCKYFVKIIINIILMLNFLLNKIFLSLKLIQLNSKYDGVRYVWLTWAFKLCPLLKHNTLRYLISYANLNAPIIANDELWNILQRSDWRHYLQNTADSFRCRIFHIRDTAPQRRRLVIFREQIARSILPSQNVWIARSHLGAVLLQLEDARVV